MDGAAFLARMTALIEEDGGDPEVCHGQADRLLIEAIQDMAAQRTDKDEWLAALQMYVSMERWYA